jgi:hypothetical protein
MPWAADVECNLPAVSFVFWRVVQIILGRQQKKNSARVWRPRYIHAEVPGWQKNVNVTIDDHVAAIPRVTVLICNMDDDKSM